MAIKVESYATNDGERYSISGLTFAQMFRIKHATYEHSQRLKAIAENELSGHEQMRKNFEEYVCDALDVFEAIRGFI